MRRFYDPMMCPQRYHAWSGKLREHGFEGAGDYWWDARGREYSMGSALEIVAFWEARDRIVHEVRALGAVFARLAEDMKPAIAEFTKAVNTPEMQRLVKFAEAAATTEGKEPS